MTDAGNQQLPFGSDDLRLPDALRGPLRAHLDALRERYHRRGWGGPVGFGAAARAWSSSTSPWPGRTRGGPEIGSAVDSVVEATARVLAAARAAGIFTVFTTWAYDPAAPPSPHDAKNALHLGPGDEKLLELDPRVERRPTELLLRKRYASAFKGTNLHEMLDRSGHRHADRHRAQHEPLRLRDVPRRHRQLPGHRAAGGGRGALRALPRGQPARHRAGPRRRRARSTQVIRYLAGVRL